MASIDYPEFQSPAVGAYTQKAQDFVVDTHRIGGQIIKKNHMNIFPAKNLETADIAAIRAAFDGAEEAVARGDLRAVLEMDRSFHKAVALATHNPLLSRFIISLQNIATRYWIFAMERQSPEEQLNDIRLHREAGEAIARRDVAAAEAAMERLVGDPPSAAR